MKKNKKFKLITTITLIFTFLLTNIKVFAVEINSTDAESYLNYDSPTWGKVLPIGNHRYYTPDLKTCYCLNTGALNPTGQDYTEEIKVDSGIEAILYWGYPAKDGSEWGISPDEYRYCTQLAIWSYQKEDGLSRGLDRTRLKNGTVQLSRLKPVIDFLVEKGHNKELPTFFEVTPNDITAHQEGDFFVSDPIKIKSDYSFDNAVVSIKDTSNPELGKDIIIKDMDGNVKSEGYKANESFRVYIPVDAETGNLKVNVKATVELPALLAYATPVAGKQDMSLVDLRYQNMSKDNVNVKWTGLNGAIKLIKKGDDGTLLTGAKFDLKDSNGNKVAEATSLNGQVAFNDLNPGEYTIEETSAPNGYLIASAINVTVKPNKVTLAEMIDTQIKGRVEIIKVDAKTGEPLKGAEFEMVNAATNEVVEKMTTKEDGRIISGLHPWGQYLIREIKAPGKYVLNNEEYPVTIDEHNKVYTLEIKNERIKGNMQLLKVDADTKEPLDGINFKVTCEDGFMKGQSWDLTTENGLISLKDLELGKYRIDEIKTDWNHVLNNEPLYFEITENGQTVKLEMENRKIRGTAELIKIDAETKRPLEGAKFELWNGDKLIGTYTTDKDGKIVVENLEAGNYYWKEIEAPKHYEINEDKDLSFVIAQDGETKTITAENKVKTGELDFSKTDLTTGKNVEGAKIEIVGLDEQNKHIKIDFTSSIEGNRFTLPEGNYEFKETQAPKGYKLSTEVGKFEIKGGEVTKAELKNERIVGKLTFNKTDVTTGETIDGAKIKIECLEGLDKGKVIEFISSKDGNEFELAEGKYQFTEIQAPEGYELSTEVGQFEIKGGEVTKAELKNKRTTGKLIFTKTDAATGEVLDGAKIKLECLSGLDKGKVIEFTSSKDGNEFELLAGEYKISEMEAPNGYELTNKTGTFKITKENEVIKCNLTNKKFEIVKTGSSFDVNALLPIGLVLVVGSLGALALTRKRKEA